MDEEFIRQRITELRIQKNVSEYKMSMDLGHSKGYIQSITSGRALPSMAEFLSMCEYFEIEPAEFFNNKTKENIPHNLKSAIKNLSNEDMNLLIKLAERLNKK